MLFLNIAGSLVSYLAKWLLTLQLFTNSIDTQGKLRLNLHSLSVSELLEYRRLSRNIEACAIFQILVIQRAVIHIFSRIRDWLLAVYSTYRL